MICLYLYGSLAALCVAAVMVVYLSEAKSDWPTTMDRPEKQIRKLMRIYYWRVRRTEHQDGSVTRAIRDDRTGVTFALTQPPKGGNLSIAHK